MLERASFKAVIGHKNQIADRVFQFDLDVGRERLLASPGAHVELCFEGYRRQYSVVENLATGYRIAVQREAEGRGGSLALTQMEPGDEIVLHGPRNAFPLRSHAGCAVLIAGGIGITPIIAMANRLHEDGRPFELWYCARNASSAAYKQQLEKAAFSSLVRYEFSDETGVSVVDFLPRVRAADADDEFYVCGPEGLLNHFFSQAADAGIASDRIHYELFNRTLLEGDNDRSFTVALARSGIELRIEAGQTIYEALEEAGIEVEVSCLSGTCATCLTPVLDGIPDHRDLVMTEEEKQRGDQISICVSRARSDRLVLDL